MRAKAGLALRSLLTCNSASIAKQINLPCLSHVASFDWPRHYSTSSPTDPSSVLNSLHGAEFQYQLTQLRNQVGVIQYSKLIQEFLNSVPNTTEEDADRVATALAASGNILRHGSLVYLRPTEIAHILRRVLPLDITSVKSRLAEVESELSKLETQRSSIMRSARLRTKLVNYAFFAALVAQWGLLFRLTYWELSWDVMEPVGFFVGGLSSVASFGWFLKTRQDFTYEAMHQRFMSNYERKAFEDAKFDILEYNRLKHEAGNLHEVLEAYEEQQQGRSTRAYNV